MDKMIYVWYVFGFIAGILTIFHMCLENLQLAILCFVALVGCMVLCVYYWLSDEIKELSNEIKKRKKL